MNEDEEEKKEGDDGDDSIDIDKYKFDETIYGTFGTNEGHENPLWKPTEKDKVGEEDSEELPIETKDTVQKYIDSENPPVEKFIKREGFTDDEDEFKFIKQFRKGHTPNDEDEKKINKLSHMERLRELEK